MAIFGIFGKKDDPSAPTGKNTSRPNVAPNTTQRLPQNNTERANATARKIDAIESEMSSEFGPASAANSTLPNPLAAPPKPVFPSSNKVKPQNQLPKSFEATLPIMGMSTDFLLGEENSGGKIQVASSESAHVYEEAAILFANGQSEMAEQVLQAALHENTARNASRTAWWMLFDLYQVTGKQLQFESLAIDYARKFETSPPTWTDLSTQETRAGASTRPGSRPTVLFSGKLDSSIIKTLERAIKQAENSNVLRLDFSKVTDVDPIGCGLVLRLLKRLQKSNHELVLVGADHLVSKVRSILQVGRRNETEAPWLMVLELLRLLNREQEFEEFSIDYCVTFEVSPPSFVAPKTKVTTANTVDESAPAEEAPIDRLIMPPLVEGKAEQLITAINEFAATQRKHVALDCSRLMRVDFTAAGQLLIDLTPITADGKTIEFQQVNHLVAALFNVMGVKDIAKIVCRKY